MDWMQAAIVFTGTVVLDFLWARYTLAMQARRALAAGAYGAGIYLIGGMVTVGFVVTPLLLLPAAAGAFVGTWLGVKLHDNNDDKPQNRA